MVAPANRQDNPAEQAGLKVGSQPAEPGAVDGGNTSLIEIERLHRRFGQATLPCRADAAFDHRSRNRRRRAQARPLEARIDVGRIVDPFDAAHQKRRSQARPRHREQWAEQPHVRPFDHRGHAGKTIGATAARGAHRHGFSLVIGMMRQKEMQDATTAAFIAQQTVALGPCGCLKTTLRLFSNPAKHRSLDAMPIQ
ncbi:MAG: hypothetical protein A3D94_03020 [Alphaproteobacteria bacterium RIFCSPHIGHO2_12_FULL_66_14]|nr:MAG: hypothetical protein A3D94_03020 [Alphaproteobacteria bacterium RIFCSPHIGHO2_12_FULL_66_14]